MTKTMKTTTTLKRVISVFFAAFVMNTVMGQVPTPHAEWLFDDAADLTKASVGVDLVLVGTDEASAGPEAGDGAAKIGLGSHYKFAHGLAPEAGQSKINTYSISYQFKVPEIGKWVSFLQTDQTNGSDGDLFLRKVNGIGIGENGVGYSATTISANQWYQLILVVDNGNEFSLYLDGEKILNGAPRSVDGRFALDDTVLLFGDNDGDDNPIYVSQMSFYKQALTQEDINAINGVVAEEIAPYAEWLFDDATDLTKASVGNDLTLSGSHTVVTGPASDNGAVRIGQGSHYKYTHGLTPESGQSYINTYSVLFDFNVPALSGFNSLLQADGANADDTEICIKPAGNIGLGASGYSATAIESGEWYRLVMVVDNGAEYTLYLNGTKILDGTVQAIDGRYALRSTFNFFCDNDGEERDIDVARLSFYNQALTQAEVANLGGITSEPVMGDNPFLTTPYLQNASTSAMTIMCETSVNKAATVRYGTAATSLDKQNTSTTQKTIGYNTYVHKTRLTELAPNTTYYYSVTVNDVSSDTLSFKTFTDDANASFTVGTWSDSHTAVPWKHMADYMVEDLAVDFAFNTGDLCDKGSKREDLAKVFLPHVCQRIGSRIPFFSALGNHDVGTENSVWEAGDLIRQYLDSPSEVNSDPEAFDGSFLMMHANVAFISIDWTRMQAEVQSGAWLETTLQRSDVQNARFRFIYIHNAPFYERWQEAEKSYLQANLPSLAETYNVDAVISGHMHGYERGFLNGVTYITQGGSTKHMDVNYYNNPTIHDHIVVGTNKPDNPENFNNGLTNHFVTLHIADNAEMKLHYFSQTGDYQGVMETIDLRELTVSNAEHGAVGLQIIHHRPSGMINISCEELVAAELFDIKGNKVKATSGFSQEAQINTSGMLAGTYILRVYAENGIGTSKKLLID